MILVCYLKTGWVEKPRSLEIWDQSIPTKEVIPQKKSIVLNRGQYADSHQLWCGVQSVTVSLQFYTVSFCVMFRKIKSVQKKKNNNQRECSCTFPDKVWSGNVRT